MRLSGNKPPVNQPKELFKNINYYLNPMYFQKDFRLLRVRILI